MKDPIYHLILGLVYIFFHLEKNKVKQNSHCNSFFFYLHKVICILYLHKSNMKTNDFHSKRGFNPLSFKSYVLLVDCKMMDECNIILSANRYTMYRHLEMYCMKKPSKWTGLKFCHQV